MTLGVERKRVHSRFVDSCFCLVGAAAAGFPQPRGGPRILLDSAASLAPHLGGLRIAHEAMLAVQGAIRLLHKACGLLPIVRHAWRAACGVRRMAHNARVTLASV